MSLEITWRTDAVARLLAGVLICVFSGAFLLRGVELVISGKGNWVPVLLLAAAATLLFASMMLIWRLRGPEQLGKRLGFAGLIFYAGMLAGFVAQMLAGQVNRETTVMQMLVAALSFHGAALILVHFFLKDHQLKWSEAFGFKKNWQAAILLGLLAALIFLPLAWALQWATSQLITHLPLGIKPVEQETVQTLRRAGSWADRTTMGVVTILLAPFAEELLFRGILYRWIKGAGRPRIALWGTAFLFAAIHLNLISFLPLFVLAVLLIQLYERTSNLLAAIAAHSLFNAMNFSMLYFAMRYGA